MNVVSKRGLNQHISKAVACRKELEIWYRIAKQASWQSLVDVRVDYRTADLVGRLLIFNLLHNKYRLIVRENFQGQSLFVKAVLTHDEYDRKEWMRWNK